MTIAERSLTPLTPPTAATRSNAERLIEALAGIDAWNRARREVEVWAAAGSSREMRLDRSRRLDMIRREHRSLVEATDRQLRDAGSFNRSDSAPRAVVVHRNDWFKSTVRTRLRESGIEIVAELSNGADAVGLVVAEQPELLLLEDKLPMVGGAEMIREVRRYAPSTIMVVQVEHDGDTGRYLEAGARRAFGRHVPPQQIAAAMRELLAG